mgnify:CR=1 FL=1
MNTNTDLEELNARLTRIETRLCTLMVHLGMDTPGKPTRNPDHRPMAIPRDYAQASNGNRVLPTGVFAKLRESLR